MSIKQIFAWIGAGLAGILAAVGGFFFARSINNDNSRNIDGIRDQLDGERDRNQSEGTAINGARKRTAEDRAAAKRERERLRQERRETEAERKRLKRDQRLIDELNKRNKG